MIRDLIRSTPLRQWVADLLGLVCLAIVMFAFVIVAAAVLP